MKRLIILVPIVLVLLIGISTANAQRTPALARYRASAVQVNEPASPQSGYSIDWYTIDGGGAMNSIGGSYSLGGSIGQPDAGQVSNLPTRSTVASGAGHRSTTISICRWC